MRLAVRLLGVVEVVLDGERLRAFDSLRLQRFLGLIALRRDEYMTIFFLLFNYFIYMCARYIRAQSVLEK